MKQEARAERELRMRKRVASRREKQAEHVRIARESKELKMRERIMRKREKQAERERAMRERKTRQRRPYWIKHFTSPAAGFKKFGIDVEVPRHLRTVFNLTEQGLQPDEIAARAGISRTCVAHQQAALRDLMTCHRLRLNRQRCEHNYAHSKRAGQMLERWPDLPEFLPRGYVCALNPAYTATLALRTTRRDFRVRGQRFFE